MTQNISPIGVPGMDTPSWANYTAPSPLSLTPPTSLAGMTPSQFHRVYGAPTQFGSAYGKGLDTPYQGSRGLVDMALDWNGDGKSWAGDQWQGLKDNIAERQFFNPENSWMDNIGQVANLAGAGLSLANMWQNLKQGKESFKLNKERMETDMAQNAAEYAAHKQRQAGTDSAIAAANERAKNLNFG